MPIMKEHFLRSAHDTTFSPQGLYNFIDGSVTTDSSGNNRTLTESESATNDSDFIPGQADGLSHFTLYRNNTGDFNYTGAMSYCCLINTSQFIPDSSNSHALLGGWEGGASGASINANVDARYMFQINNSGHLRYNHQTNSVSGTATNNLVTTDDKVRSLHEWQHAAFTRDSNGTAIKIYLDGIEIKSATLGAAPGTHAADNGYFAIGDIYNYNRTLTNSVIISSCAIYNQELSANQIKYLARKTLGFNRVN